MGNEDVILLSSIKNITEREIFIFLENFDSIDDLKASNIIDVSKHLGISVRTLSSIKNEEFDRTILNRVKSLNIEVILYTDKEYPKKLLRYKPFPPVLYVRGNKTLLNEMGIAIVGSRRCSYYGKGIAEDFGKKLSMNGLTVISGMALGIDRYSHVGALNGYGNTIAVLGTGIDIIYPASNRDIYNEIVEKGCIISEFPPGTRPFKQNFPFRNRIIAGLSDGVLVVEAAYKSGTFKTVKWALDFGIDVYAIPGDITRPTSQGTDLLIKEGAIPVVSSEDFLTQLGRGKTDTLDKGILKPKYELEGANKKVFAKIKSIPIHFDMILEQTGLSISELSGITMDLELKGLIEKMPGNFYKRL